jgi:hypothetical protein
MSNASANTTLTGDRVVSTTLRELSTPPGRPHLGGHPDVAIKDLIRLGAHAHLIT